jgi:thiamine kinase-like enzyme
LQALDFESPQGQALEAYLQDELLPAFNEIRSWCLQRIEAAGRTEDSELEIMDRTLSPSDFGFHNCLKQDDGRLMFLDFEYFGWDDPAKMVSDFLLHPAMELSPSLKSQFLEGVLQGMDPDQRLRTRVTTMYPLFGLKWCLILLNEFLPESLARRRFSSGMEINNIELQEQQLEKSRQVLQKVRSSDERFPCW